MGSVSRQASHTGLLATRWHEVLESSHVDFVHFLAHDGVGDLHVRQLVVNLISALTARPRVRPVIT